MQDLRILLHILIFQKQYILLKKGLVLTGVEKEDLRMMLKSYGKSRGCTWHHLEDGKGILLVETKIHSRFHHSGRASILRNVK